MSLSDVPQRFRDLSDERYFGSLAAHEASHIVTGMALGLEPMAAQATRTGTPLTSADTPP